MVLTANRFDDIHRYRFTAAHELVYRVKRAGHVTSKMRFQSAQLIAYLSDGLWLRTAAHANDRMSELAGGLEKLGVGFANRPDVNMLFVHVDEAVSDRLERAGLLFYRMGPGLIRLVTSWQTTPEEVETALTTFAAAL